MIKQKSKKTKIVMALVFLAIFAGLMLFLFSGNNLHIVKEVFRDGATQDEIREALASFGWRGYITIGILSMLQVVFAFLPAEPVQVISGLSFGMWIGGLICLIGVILGNTILYIGYKIFGEKLGQYFETHADFDFSVARKSKKISAIIFILYFLPAIPYGLICLFAASVGLKYPKYIILTTLGVIPSVLIGVGLGHVAISSSWILSIAVFLVLIVLLIFMFRYRDKLFKKINAYIKKRQERELIKTPGPIYKALLTIVLKVGFVSKIKIRYKNRPKKIKGPAIILCNHGSFIDFAYAAMLLKKSRPNYVSARLYFYHNLLGKFMHSLGCHPKSMFTSDIESVKTCLKVINTGGLLAMMPEARLSTVGKFEDVQESTYKFIKKMGVDVYAVKFNGDYLANPKWGKGARRGSLVEVGIDKIICADEFKTLTESELINRVETALDYDEFKWLETKPNVHYKCKTIAEGLENILYLCPHCGKKYSLSSKKNVLTCDSCGKTWTVGDRYQFIDDEKFDNFATWYEWQNKQMEELAAKGEYELRSKVELRHASIDGKSCTRHAGEGECVLNKDGLRYVGTDDGKEIEKFFPMSQIYRLLFGAGEDFEIYEGKQIWYFVPEEKRSAVEWYVASGILKNLETASQN